MELFMAILAIELEINGLLEENNCIHFLLWLPTYIFMIFSIKIFQKTPKILQFKLG